MEQINRSRVSLAEPEASLIGKYLPHTFSTPDARHLHSMSSYTGKSTIPSPLSRTPIARYPRAVPADQ